MDCFTQHERQCWHSGSLKSKEVLLKELLLSLVVGLIFIIAVALIFDRKRFYQYITNINMRRRREQPTFISGAKEVVKALLAGTVNRHLTFRKHCI